MKEFDVNTDVLQRAKENRLLYLQQQLAETQLSITILQNSFAAYGDPAEQTMLQNEIKKWDRLVVNYETVIGVDTHGSANSTDSTA